MNYLILVLGSLLFSACRETKSYTIINGEDKTVVITTNTVPECHGKKCK